MATCPFCGMMTEVPHDTQEACIHALQEEVARVRGILDSSQRPGDDPPGLKASRKEKEKDAEEPEQ